MREPYLEPSPTRGDLPVAEQPKFAWLGRILVHGHLDARKSNQAGVQDRDQRGFSLFFEFLITSHRIQEAVNAVVPHPIAVVRLRLPKNMSEEDEQGNKGG